jgi:hypothetical protein
MNMSYSSFSSTNVNGVESYNGIVAGSGSQLLRCSNKVYNEVSVFFTFYVPVTSMITSTGMKVKVEAVKAGISQVQGGARISPRGPGLDYTDATGKDFSFTVWSGYYTLTMSVEAQA